MAVKLPNSKRNLDMAIRRMGTGDTDYLRMRTLIANVIVAQLMPDGAVKGGSALKIRFGDGATRATTDLDAARASDLGAFVPAFEANLERGWNGFTARLVAREPASPAGVPSAYVMQPYEVKISYLGGAWCTVEFELGHDEIGDADEPDMVEPVEASRALQAMGFPAPDPIPLMPLHHQIAQKLHGASEEGSRRAHDLVDLQLIIAKGDIDYVKTRETCARLFAYRQAQAWPPTIMASDNWGQVYEEQSMGVDALPTVDEAVAWANGLIARIDAS